MAKATTRVKTVERLEVQTVQVHDGVTLELSAAEADVLAVILSKVGGDARCTDRGHATAIIDALRAAGHCFTKWTTEERRRAVDGCIMFVGRLQERK